MNHRRITHMYQPQSPPPPPPNSANGFPPPASSPANSNNIHQVPVNLPPSIDIDHSLYDSLSSLSLSQNNDGGGRIFLPPESTYRRRGSPISGEGFRSSVYGNTRLEEVFRASNGGSYNQGVYSGVGHTTPRTVDAFLHQRAFSSAFDRRFDFDPRSYLLAKERFYHSQRLNGFDNRRSTTPSVAISEECHVRCNNFSMSSNNNNNNIIQNHGGVSKLQINQYLRFMSLNDLRGKICVLAKDQEGWRILQSKLEEPTKEEIEIVFSEVMGSIADLMTHPYGNYLIQMLVCVCDDDQKALIVHELTERSVDIILVCMNVYGTRAVQKLLENLKSQNLIMKVIMALHRCAVQLASDPNGHHVLQFCLQHFDSDFNQPILNQIADNCFKVATDRSGCCVMQACIQQSCGEVRNRLIAEIMANAIPMAEDPFGNYVLQHMVGQQSRELTALLVSQLQGSFAYLSQNKYASNVVEKCLTESGLDVSTKIILELVESPNASSLLVDPYGNFVIQSALKVSRGLAFERLRKLISRNIHSMQSNLYGKKILEKLEKRRIIHN